MQAKKIKATKCCCVGCFLTQGKRERGIIEEKDIFLLGPMTIGHLAERSFRPCKRILWWQMTTADNGKSVGVLIKIEMENTTCSTRDQRHEEGSTSQSTFPYFWDHCQWLGYGQGCGIALCQVCFPLSGGRCATRADKMHPSCGDQEVKEVLTFHLLV
jgi:hypothetical protein